MAIGSGRVTEGGRVRAPVLGMLGLWLLAFAAREASAAYFVYVSFESSNAIGVYQMDPEAGSLELKATLPVTGGPAPLALSPDQRFMYVSQRPAKTFSAYSVNRGTGALTFLNTIAAPENAVHIATDRSGRYLLSAYYGAARMAIHAIGGDGKLVSQPVENLATGANPHFIHTDPSNRYLYVPNLGAGKTLQFSFDSATGKIQPLNPPEVNAAAGAGPRHFTFHGAKDILYLVNELNRSLTVYAMDPAKGTLSPLQTLPTVPGTYSGSNACADIHITPDNRFVYASNRGHQSLAGYRVDAVTGQLTAIGWFTAPTTPRSFAIDPSGKFVFAAGQSADTLASYRINQTTGALEPLKLYPTGDSPAWVLAVRFQEGPSAAGRAGVRGQGEGARHGEKMVVENSRGFRGRVYSLLGRLLGSRRETAATPAP